MWINAEVKSRKVDITYRFGVFGFGLVFKNLLLNTYWKSSWSAKWHAVLRVFQPQARKLGLSVNVKCNGKLEY